MKEEYLYKESLGKGKSKVHVITIKDGDKRGGWYRQLTAIEGLVNRSSKRWYYHYYTKKNHPKFPNARVRFTRIDKFEERMNKTLAEKHGFEYKEPEKVYHDSVWDFMDSIGYDHKNKKVANIDKYLIIGL